MLHVSRVDGVINGSDYTYHPDPVHVAISRIIPAFPAHTLIDEVLGVFRSFEMWGLLDQPTTVWTDDPSYPEPYDLLGSSVRVSPTQELPRGVCLRSLVVGWTNLHAVGHAGRGPSGNWGDTNWRENSITLPFANIPRMELLRFRDHVWRRYGIAKPHTAHPPHVLIVQHNNGTTPSRILNIDEIVGTLESPSDEIASMLGVPSGGSMRVSRVEWRGLPIRRQVELTASADVLITLPGSDACNALFLPTPAALIIPFRPQKEKNTSTFNWRGSSEISYLFDSVPRLFSYQFDPRTDAWSLWRGKDGKRLEPGASAPSMNVNVSEDGFYLDVRLLVSRFLRVALARLRMEGSVL